jgi:hypothetical protein
MISDREEKNGTVSASTKTEDVKENIKVDDNKKLQN